MNRIILLSIAMVVGMCVSVSAQVKPFLRMDGSFQSMSHPDLPQSENASEHCPEAESMLEGLSGGLYAGLKVGRVTLQTGARASRRLIEMTPELARQDFRSAQVITATADGSVQFLQANWLELPAHLQFDLCQFEGDRRSYVFLGGSIYRDLSQPGSPAISEAKGAVPQLPGFWSFTIGTGVEKFISPHISLHGETAVDWLSIRRGSTFRLNVGMTFYPTGAF